MLDAAAMTHDTTATCLVLSSVELSLPLLLGPAFLAPSSVEVKWRSPAEKAASAEKLRSLILKGEAQSSDHCDILRRSERSHARSQKPPRVSLRMPNHIHRMIDTAATSYSKSQTEIIVAALNLWLPRFLKQKETDGSRKASSSAIDRDKKKLYEVRVSSEFFKLLMSVVTQTRLTLTYIVSCSLVGAGILFTPPLIEPGTVRSNKRKWSLFSRKEIGELQAEALSFLGVNEASCPHLCVKWRDAVRSCIQSRKTRRISIRLSNHDRRWLGLISSVHGISQTELTIVAIGLYLPRLRPGGYCPVCSKVLLPIAGKRLCPTVR
jgi:Arc/MetJ-type ribon-helix-helix transcriptional regulator